MAVPCGQALAVGSDGLAAQVIARGLDVPCPLAQGRESLGTSQSRHKRSRRKGKYRGGRADRR